MMNKLGVNEQKLEEIEKELIKSKLKLLDFNFTFNLSNFDFAYLISLHKFLFSEFYFDTDLSVRNIDEKEIKLINMNLKEIVNICVSDNKDINKINSLIEEIWYIQPFMVGNTRTLIGFLKILKECFLLDIEIDLDYSISSTPNIFNDIVNQKRLTKK